GVSADCASEVQVAVLTTYLAEGVRNFVGKVVGPIAEVASCTADDSYCDLVIPAIVYTAAKGVVYDFPKLLIEQTVQAWDVAKNLSAIAHDGNGNPVSAAQLISQGCGSGLCDSDHLNKELQDNWIAQSLIGAVMTGDASIKQDRTNTPHFTIDGPLGIPIRIYPDSPLYAELMGQRQQSQYQPPTLDNTLSKEDTRFMINVDPKDGMSISYSCIDQGGCIYDDTKEQGDGFAITIPYGPDTLTSDFGPAFDQLADSQIADITSGLEHLLQSTQDDYLEPLAQSYDFDLDDLFTPDSALAGDRLSSQQDIGSLGRELEGQRVDDLDPSIMSLPEGDSGQSYSEPSLPDYSDQRSYEQDYSPDTTSPEPYSYNSDG
ncbi:MAG: hypothetical protein Q8P59_00385, partial [Dehalococcoidia bacterium]|nr:hypothetical protein [Dehalococcoidia bacterium]